MAITSNLVEVQIRFTYLDQKCLVRQFYETDGAAFLTATPATVGEAYWNDIKTLWRAMLSNSTLVSSTDEIFVREIGGGLSYGSYPVPTGERVGTRAAGNDGEWLPGYVDAGIKLTVGTSVTRPGQKRVPFVRKGDIDGNTLLNTYVGLVTGASVIWSADRTLGAPVATGVLHPVVVRTASLLTSPVFQRVVGASISTRATSQVSRKLGHGN